MPKTIAVIGTLDTKGEEFRYLKEEIERRGHQTLVIDIGVLGDPAFEPDIDRAAVAMAGGLSINALREERDRGHALKVMGLGAAKLATQLYADGRFDGIIGMGGSGGTVVATSAMRALPVGVPKVMLSTVATGDVGPYVGTRDVTMIPSVVDVAGFNQISRRIYANAAGAIVGMVEAELPQAVTRPLVAATMFGNTTPAVDKARQIMEEHGYEVLVFHCTGTGGRTMEGLVRDGYIKGVLDITTTEWADEICGGVLSAGPERLSAAAETGTPQVIVPGCLDMVNFWARGTVPEKYRDRTLYEWNPNVTLMRTNLEENREMGRIFAQRANGAKGPVAFFVPLGGFSMLDKKGEPFWDPAANGAFLEMLKRNLRPDIPVYEMDNNVNDDEFARAVAEKMLEFIEKK